MLPRLFLALCAVMALAACDPSVGVGASSSTGASVQGGETGTQTRTHNYRMSGSRSGMR